MKALEAFGRIASPKTVVPVSWVTAALVRRRDGALQIAVGTSLAVLVADLLKRWIRRPRPWPFEQNPLRSFPSGHSAASTAYLLGVALVAPREHRPAALVAAGAGAVAVNALRLVAEEHWPTDVVAGDALGIASVAAAHLALASANATRRS